ncbi:unnamed protein product [Rotaria sp. Silwood1]|nr:unnamed protein product [Rotaria sp. Silwood1]CAF1112035.1 unnamed protein product [Rotaria sp. Silwood1]CAF3444944.1 unnamed protein product [Rotaria sp. Silwood1]CAF4495445.1 unnamed protein product [Rotaria sp. Silwood1]CAF4574656.1 unnamed protein product [Rotaria sp. Silwood1]
MSSCRCCLVPHPLRLIERFNLSIQTIKLIRRNCLIFENIFLDEYEHLERISSNLNKYLIHSNTISNQIYSYLSQLTRQFNNRLENLRIFLNKFECLIIKCSIWLKTNSIKSIHSQLKYYRKKFDLFNKFFVQHSNINSYKNNLIKKFRNDFSIFQINYQQYCLQMDSIEYKHIKVFLESIQLFSSIISLENNNMINSTINIDHNIKEWKEKNKFHITWLPDEHQQNEKNNHLLTFENENKHVEQTSSDIEIKAIDNCSNDSQDKYAYESNLSWSFTIAKKQENISVSQQNPDQIELNFTKRKLI